VKHVGRRRGVCLTNLVLILGVKCCDLSLDVVQRTVLASCSTDTVRVSGQVRARQANTKFRRDNPARERQGLRPGSVVPQLLSQSRPPNPRKPRTSRIGSASGRTTSTRRSRRRAKRSRASARAPSTPWSGSRSWEQSVHSRKLAQESLEFSTKPPQSRSNHDALSFPIAPQCSLRPPTIGKSSGTDDPQLLDWLVLSLCRWPPC
jgi:hypothetical protein